MTFNARKMKIAYTYVHTYHFSGQEDCLYINVYVPREKPSSSDNMNVIVHFHGGGFMIGSGHLYAGPKYLMDADAILVTMNYRLGPFGKYVIALDIRIR